MHKKKLNLLSIFKYFDAIIFNKCLTHKLICKVFLIIVFEKKRSLKAFKSTKTW